MILPPGKLDQGRADDEAAAIAAERIRSGAAEHKEDGAEALAKLGIETVKFGGIGDKVFSTDGSTRYRS